MYLWISSLKLHTVCFYCMLSWVLSKYFEDKGCRLFVFIAYLAFLNNKRGLDLVFLPHFLHNFRIKVFLSLYYFNWPLFTVWLSLLREILGNMCIAIVCWPACEVMNFEVNGIFLVKPLFLHDQKTMTKT